MSPAAAPPPPSVAPPRAERQTGVVEPLPAAVETATHQTTSAGSSCPRPSAQKKPHERFLSCVSTTLTCALCLLDIPSPIVERQNRPDIEVKEMDRVAHLKPVLISLDQEQRCLIEVCVNSVRVSFVFRKADEIETVLVRKYCQFLTRATAGIMGHALDVCRKKPVSAHQVGYPGDDAGHAAERYAAVPRDRSVVSAAGGGGGFYDEEELISAENNHGTPWDISFVFTASRRAQLGNRNCKVLVAPVPVGMDNCGVVAPEYRKIRRRDSTDLAALRERDRRRGSGEGVVVRGEPPSSAEQCSDLPSAVVGGPPRRPVNKSSAAEGAKVDEQAAAPSAAAAGPPMNSKERAPRPLRPLFAPTADGTLSTIVAAKNADALLTGTGQQVNPNNVWCSKHDLNPDEEPNSLFSEVVSLRGVSRTKQVDWLVAFWKDFVKEVGGGVLE